ncbi:MAG: hypothetical protein QXK06_04850 [Candidatus Diapherotrites archaeon]
MQNEMPEFAKEIENTLKKTFVFFNQLDFVILNESRKDQIENEATYDSVLEFPTRTPKKVLEKIKIGDKVITDDIRFQVFKSDKKILEIKKPAKILRFE